MPIYEYRCSDCGFQDEFLQKLSEPQMTLCPSCGKESLKKLLSAAGFQLKGSGWYATDFKGSGSAPAAKPGATAKAGASAAGDTSASKSSESTSSGDKPAADAGATATPKAPTAAASS